MPCVRVLVNGDGRRNLGVLDHSCPNAFRVRVFGPPITSTCAVVCRRLKGPYGALTCLLGVRRLVRPSPILYHGATLGVGVRSLLVKFVPTGSLLPVDSALPLRTTCLSLVDLSIGEMSVSGVFSRGVGSPRGGQVLRRSTTSLVVHLYVQGGGNVSYPTKFRQGLRDVGQARSVPSQFRVVLQAFSPIGSQASLAKDFSISRAIVTFLTPLRLQVSLAYYRIVTSGLVVLVCSVRSQYVFPRRRRLLVHGFLVSPS